MSAMSSSGSAAAFLLVRPVPVVSACGPAALSRPVSELEPPSSLAAFLPLRPGTLGRPPEIRSSSSATPAMMTPSQVFVENANEAPNLTKAEPCVPSAGCHARFDQDDLRQLRPGELHDDQEQADDVREVRDQEVLPRVP